MQNSMPQFPGAANDKTVAEPPQNAKDHMDPLAFHEGWARMCGFRFHGSRLFQGGCGFGEVEIESPTLNFIKAEAEKNSQYSFSAPSVHGQCCADGPPKTGFWRSTNPRLCGRLPFRELNMGRDE
jgi:hypothetical protein